MAATITVQQSNIAPKGAQEVGLMLEQIAAIVVGGLLLDFMRNIMK